MLKFEETRRSQKKNLVKVLICIQERRGFTLKKIPRECVNKRRKIYDNFGPMYRPVWREHLESREKSKRWGWMSKPSVPSNSKPLPPRDTWKLVPVNSHVNWDVRRTTYDNIRYQVVRRYLFWSAISPIESIND